MNKIKSRGLVVLLFMFFSVGLSSCATSYKKVTKQYSEEETLFNLTISKVNLSSKKGQIINDSIGRNNYDKEKTKWRDSVSIAFGEKSQITYKASSQTNKGKNNNGLAGIKNTKKEKSPGKDTDITSQYKEILINNKVFSETAGIEKAEIDVSLIYVEHLFADYREPANPVEKLFYLAPWIIFDRNIYMVLGLNLKIDGEVVDSVELDAFARGPGRTSAVETGIKNVFYKYSLYLHDKFSENKINRLVTYDDLDGRNENLGQIAALHAVYTPPWFVVTFGLALFLAAGETLNTVGEGLSVVLEDPETMRNINNFTNELAQDNKKFNSDLNANYSRAIAEQNRRDNLKQYTSSNSSNSGYSSSESEYEAGARRSKEQKEWMDGGSKGQSPYEIRNATSVSTDASNKVSNYTGKGASTNSQKSMDQQCIDGHSHKYGKGYKITWSDSKKKCTVQKVASKENTDLSKSSQANKNSSKAKKEKQYKDTFELLAYCHPSEKAIKAGKSLGNSDEKIWKCNGKLQKTQDNKTLNGALGSVGCVGATTSRAMIYNKGYILFCNVPVYRDGGKDTWYRDITSLMSIPNRILNKRITYTCEIDNYKGAIKEGTCK